MVGCSDSPASYKVVRGDSLSVIARREGRSVAELRTWNGISGDLIEVGQVLKVAPPPVAGSQTGFSRMMDLTVPARELVAGWLAALTRDEPVSSAEPPSQSGALAAADSSIKVSDRRPRRGNRSAPPAGSAAADGLGTRREAQAAAAWPALRRPAAKPCLAEDAGIGEGAFGRSKGLDHEQISVATRAFQRQTLRCYEGRENAEGQVLLALVVGCDGLVRSSQVQSDGTAAPGFADCVADVMRYAAFPAHARDSIEVVVPMHFVADTSAP